VIGYLSLTRAALRRWTTRAVFVLLLLSLACFESIDTEPYINQSYYHQTIEALNQEGSFMSADTGTLMAGAAKISITPAPGTHGGDLHDLPLAGYGARQGRPAQGILDEVHARALWIRKGTFERVILSLEMLIPPPEAVLALEEKIKDRLGIDPSTIYWGATHTHSGPGGWGVGWLAEAFAGPHHASFQPWLTERIFTCLEAARLDLQPVQWASTSVTTDGLVRNRLVGEKGQVDQQLDSMFFRAGDRVLATIGVFSAHATVVGAHSLDYCGDYPGHWASKIEAATGGTALFLAGGVGSHAAIPPSGNHQGAVQLGEQLAILSLAHLQEAIFSDKVSLAYGEAPVYLPSPHIRIWRVWRLRPWLARLILPIERAVKVQAFQIGNALMISTPCDFSGELCLPIRANFAQHNTHAMVTSFNGHYIGYVVPQKYYFLNEYETQIMGFYGPQMAPYMSEIIMRLGTATLKTNLVGLEIKRAANQAP